MANILRSDDRGIAILTFNRPERLNAINTIMLAELDAHLAAIESDSSRAFVITGSPRAFCVGSDLKEVGADGDARIRHMHALAQRLREFPKIGVAAMAGYALGGGLEMALGLHFRLAAPGAILGLPEVKLGLMPAYGATQLLPRLIGETRTLDLMLSGDPIDPATALSWGLVDRISENVVQAAVDFALARAGNKPIAEAAIRQAVHASHLPLPEGMELEWKLALATSASDQARAALAAFKAG
ncbi:MAG: enoyl-CoA hydratase [Alphaproteobacteria bacterium HGW-Alphaproteobacteria-16]|nr:MAG: enoyl-CoA hydratase [Alphaproteobacteria bacterium HGW-Alphaproteobacteria-16]